MRKLACIVIIGAVVLIWLGRDRQVSDEGYTFSATVLEVEENQAVLVMDEHGGEIRLTLPKGEKKASLAVGTILSVTVTGGILESYPAQATAKKIDILGRKEMNDSYARKGYVVSRHGELFNLWKLNSFSMGLREELTLVTYTDEGDPIFTTLQRVGEIIKVAYDTREDAFGVKQILHYQAQLLEKVEEATQTIYVLKNCSGSGQSGDVELLTIEKN